jgi:hypothetical protein
LELPAATAHKARRILEQLRITNLISLGNAGERQSKMKEVSLKRSAASRYILHSGSSDVPSR